MITYLAKETFPRAHYARAARQRAFTRYLASAVPGSVSVYSEVGGSSATARGAFQAIGRLLVGLNTVWRSRNQWVVVDYPNFPASVPRRFSVYVVAMSYLMALRAVCAIRGMGVVVQSDDDPLLQDQGLGVELTPGQIFWERSFEKRLYRSADRLWFSGQTAAEMLCSLFDVPISRAVQVPNGADPPGESVPGPSDQLFRFAYAGALLPDSHGVAGLLRAFRLTVAPHARLVLAGPEGEWIPGYLEQSPDDRVVYLGCLTAEEVQSVLATCDAGVLTGQPGGYHDTGFPGKLGAYFAAGLPVVCTCGGEAARIIETCGVGVACAESELGPTLGALVHDTVSYGTMRANSLATQQDYYWDRIYDRAVCGLSRATPTAGREAPDATQPEALASGWRSGGWRG